MFYLIRHGTADYTEKDTKIYQGFGNHLAPLSAKGIQEIETTAADPQLAQARLILSSPYTRALQSAAILSRRLQIPIQIETDLHEWLVAKPIPIYQTNRQYGITVNFRPATVFILRQEKASVYPFPRCASASSVFCVVIAAWETSSLSVMVW